MNKPDHPVRSALIALCTAAALQAQPAKPAAPAAPASFTEALLQGTPSANLRLRCESVEQNGVNDADALTLRTRLGYTTAAYSGFQAMLEGEYTAKLAGDYYDGSGTNGSNLATIGDPQNAEINQFWVSYANAATKATVGRQRIVLDNARFVGDVGWRQNMQTYDAVQVQDKTFGKTTLTYAYLNRINRVFDDSKNQQDYASNSHLLNASYAGLPLGTLTGYGYFLDLDADGATRVVAHNNSTSTVGLSFAGSRPVTNVVKALYRLEYARQQDYADSAVNYSADYTFVELGAGAKGHTLVAGYEVLGSDNNQGFRTPLATLHAMNGWADVFLTTPAAGLTDTYLKGTAKLPANLDLTAFYHVYGTDKGAAHIGNEADAMLGYKFNKQLTFAGKYAKFESGQTGFADREKFWLQAEYTY